MDQIRTGSLIRRLRLEQGMTQLALAERLGVSDKAVSKWDGAAVRQIADRLCYTGGKPTAIFTPCKGGGSHEIGAIRPNRRKTAFYHCQINRRQPASKHKTAPCARHDAVFLLDAAFSTLINFMGYRPLYQVVYAFLRNSVEIRKKCRRKHPPLIRPFLCSL